MKSGKLSRISWWVRQKRTVIVYFLLALILSRLLRSSGDFFTSIFVYTGMFWVFSYTELCRKYHRPHNPQTTATLKVSTEPFVEWLVTTLEGEKVVAGSGNCRIDLPSTGVRIEREMKVKFSEYVYAVEVTSGNGDAFVSLLVEGDDEFLQTVACSRSGDSEVIYTHLNTGYGTRHWMIPGFLQGIPN